MHRVQGMGLVGDLSPQEAKPMLLHREDRLHVEREGVAEDPVIVKHEGVHVVVRPLFAPHVGRLVAVGGIVGVRGFMSQGVHHGHAHRHEARGQQDRCDEYAPGVTGEMWQPSHVGA